MYRYKRLFAVAGFLGLLFVVFRWSGPQEHFSLAFVQQKFLDNKLSGMLIFVALFAGQPGRERALGRRQLAMKSIAACARPDWARGFFDW